MVFGDQLPKHTGWLHAQGFFMPSLSKALSSPHGTPCPWDLQGSFPHLLQILSSDLGGALPGTLFLFFF